MFYFLIILGLISITLGLYIEKKSSVKMPYDAVSQLEERIRRLEVLSEKANEPSVDLKIENDLIEENFKEVLKESIDNHKDDITKGNVEVSLEHQESLEKYKKICEYESENKTLDEICSLMQMKKGEVLLLKNLYKDL